MKTLIAAAIRCSLVLLVPAAAYAISAQWDLDPISGDWNTAANWTPNGVPNGPSNTATFGLSNTSDVSISANTEVNSIVFTPAATNPYTITASPGLRLTISGVGIVNNSGRTQNFLTSDDASGNAGTIIFSHHASAGSNVSISNQGGSTNFYDRSTAGGASISNEHGGTTNFFNRSSGGVSNEGGTTNFFDRSSGGVSNEGGTTNFFDRSSGGVSNEGGTTNFFDRSTGSVTNFGDSTTNFFDRSTGSVTDGDGVTNFFDRSTCGGLEFGYHGYAAFFDSSSAGNAGIFVHDQGSLYFYGNSTAGNAHLGSLGSIEFSDSSTAGSAFVAGRFVSFFGASRGGTAQIFLSFDTDFFTFGELFIDHNVTIGSLGGTEGTFVDLGANNLTVGSNNLSTTFSGVIQDGGVNGGVGGSLTKIGTGTLDLTGANTYSGDTKVNRGVLQVDGSITSNTFVNQRGTLAGTGTINGNVTNNGRVSPGSAASPGMLTVTDNYTQTQFATLMIQLAGTNAGEFSVLNVLGNANLNGFLDPMLLNGFAPTIGDSFTFLNYASFTGEFSHIKHPFLGNGLQWSVMYEANQAILTVEQHVPDQVSTLLLLTLGLLGLVTFRKQLVH